MRRLTAKHRKRDAKSAFAWVLCRRLQSRQPARAGSRDANHPPPVQNTATLACSWDEGNYPSRTGVLGSVASRVVLKPLTNAVAPLTMTAK